MGESPEGQGIRKRNLNHTSWEPSFGQLCPAPAVMLSAPSSHGRAETYVELLQLVVDGLYLGNIRDSEDRENLTKNGVTHILSVHNNARPKLQDMTYLCISASDSSSQNLTCHEHISERFLEELNIIISSLQMGKPRIQHFKESIKFIHECRLRGGGCLIHCLAGVSRSTTILVAYLMTVTDFSWEECLSATKAVRSYVSPNFGFQQQLQEYQMTLLREYRMWVQQEYGKNPFNDQEQLQCLIAEQEEKQREQQLGRREYHWINSPPPNYPLPYNAYGTSSNRWMNR